MSSRVGGRAVVFAPTGREAAALDREAIASGVPGAALMEAAGRSVARVVDGLFPEGRVVGLVGSGNNGGDTLVALRTLTAWGRPACAILVSGRSPDTRALLRGWPVEVLDDRNSAEVAFERLGNAAVLLDGILGTGVRGAPRARQARAIEKLNRAGAPVVSVDLPSGSSAETGAVPGAVVSATVTVAFGGPKLGTLLHPARAHAGRILAVEIGFPDWSDRGLAQVVTPAWAADRMPRRAADTHKNAVGRIAVVGGAPRLAGAATLTAKSAFRTGAGYVRVCGEASSRSPLLAALPEAVFVDWDEVDDLAAALGASDVVAIGPGLGTDDRAASVAARSLAATPLGIPVIADADALNVAALGHLDLAALAERHPLLLTPHAGEAARLLDTGTRSVQADRPAALWALVNRFGCTVLLKGAPSMVLAPTGSLLVDSGGTSSLAVSGMGDALTGAIAALAPGIGSFPGTGSLAVAAALGLHLTGGAAALSGMGLGVTPSDVAELLPRARAELVDLATRPPPGARFAGASVLFDSPPVGTRR